MDVWMEYGLCHRMEKAMLEYVRSEDFLLDSPTYLRMDVVVSFLFFIHMLIIVIDIIALSRS